MLNNKIIVVIGGLGLLGKELVKAIEKEKGIVIICDKSKSTKNNFLNLDITQEKSIKSVIDKIIKKYNKIDAVINAAYPRNKNYGRKFEKVTYKDFCQNLNLHLGGYFLVSKIFAEFFKEQGYGNIINISSVYGVIAPKFEIYTKTEMTVPIEYACIKSSIIHMTKYIAKYYRQTGLRINCISPGGILDNQPKAFIKKYNDNCMSKGMLKKDSLNGIALYLLSDYSQYINGQNIIVDDGFVL